MIDKNGQSHRKNLQRFQAPTETEIRVGDGIENNAIEAVRRQRKMTKSMQSGKTSVASCRPVIALHVHEGPHAANGCSCFSEE